MTSKLKLRRVGDTFDPNADLEENTIYFQKTTGNSLKITASNADGSVRSMTMSLPEIYQSAYNALNSVSGFMRFPYSDIREKPTGFPPSAHGHPASEITDIAEAIRGTKRTFDAQQANKNSVFQAGGTGMIMNLDNTGNVVFTELSRDTLKVSATNNRVPGSTYIHVIKTNGFLFYSNLFAAFSLPDAVSFQGGTWVVAITISPNNFPIPLMNPFKIAD